MKTKIIQNLLEDGCISVYQTVLKMQNAKNLRASFNYMWHCSYNSMEGFCSIERNQKKPYKFAKSPKIVIIL